MRRPNLRSLALSTLFVCFGCGEFHDGGAEVASREPQPVPDARLGYRDSASVVDGACERIEIEDALRERGVLESFGAVGAWEIYADDRLGCSEVYLQDRVECELLQGGWVVLDAEGEILAFRNAAVPLVSALISPEGVRCIGRPQHQGLPR